jgi:hypothetical protein
MGHIRGHGCRDLPVYCNSGRCHHSATMNADWLSDEAPMRSLCRRMVCTECTCDPTGVRTSTSGASEGARAAFTTIQAWAPSIVVNKLVTKYGRAPPPTPSKFSDPLSVPPSDLPENSPHRRRRHRRSVKRGSRELDGDARCAAQACWTT